MDESKQNNSITYAGQPSIKDDPKFQISNFLKQRKIGEGAFGKVYKVKEIKTGEIYAAKVSINQIEQIPEDFVSEINILSKLDHPSVIKFIGYSPIDFKKNKNPVIITEYAPKGSLENFLVSNNIKIDDTRKLIIIYGIASAMSYLHLHNIIHRDLKPANILLDQFLLPKISDFGLSKINFLHSEKSTNNEIIGTPIYISPEIWKSKKYTDACDVYAFALIIYEIMTNEKPFDGLNLYQIMLNVSSGARPQFTCEIPKSYRDLIEICWSQEHYKRPSFSQIVDMLIKDRGFITDNVKEEVFFAYVNYLNGFKVKFHSLDKSFSSEFFNFKMLNQGFIKFESKLINEFCSNFFDFKYDEFLQLDEESKNLIKSAKDDSMSQFIVGRNLIQGRKDFPINTQLGIKYLKKSIENKNSYAIIFYCKMLIKGTLIPSNLKKAIKIANKLDDLDFFQLVPKYFLNGLICMKAGSINEACDNLNIAIELNYPEAAYKMGKFILLKFK